MGISGIPAIPMIITCILQGTLCDMGIPCTFYGGKICSVVQCPQGTINFRIDIEICTSFARLICTLRSDLKGTL